MVRQESEGNVSLKSMGSKSSRMHGGKPGPEEESTRRSKLDPTSTDHYKICGRPVDDNARLSSLLLTMLQRCGVESEKFQDSTGVISEVVA